MSMLLTDDLCDKLKEKEGINSTQLENLRLDAGTDAFELSHMLIQQGISTRDSVGMVYGDSIGYTYINLEKTLFQENIVKQLSQAVAKRLKAIPIYKLGDATTVALTDPIDLAKKRELELLLGKVDFLFTLPDELDVAIAVNYKTKSDIDELFKNVDIVELRKSTDEQSSKLKATIYC